MRVLIDTNAYAALLGGREDLARLLDSAQLVYLSVIVAGELFAGFKGGQKERENRALLRDFIEKGGKTTVLPVTLETAERFGGIKESLRRRGRPLPLNDIWIAAQCMETGALLASFDRHFSEIEGLLVWDFE